MAAGAAQMLSMIVFVTMARWYVAPWLKNRGRADALIPLLGIHIFRYVALQSYGAQMAGFPISNAARDGIVYGDLSGMLLAAIGILALRRRWPVAIPVAWVLVVETAADTVRNVTAGAREHLFGLATGIAWLVVSFYVPALMVSLGLIVWQLWSRRGEAMERREAFTERQMMEALR
jgi:hypothetical protein